MSSKPTPDESSPPMTDSSHEDAINSSTTNPPNSFTPINHIYIPPSASLLPKPCTNIPHRIRPTSSPEDPQDDPATFPPDPKDLCLPLAHITKIMKNAVPPNALITREAKEDMERYVTEFIQFLTNEAAENVSITRRKTIDGGDILEAMTNTGFENYAQALRPYLERYRRRLENSSGDPSSSSPPLPSIKSGAK